MGLFGFIRRVARSVRRVARRVFHSAKRAVRSAARFVRHAVSRVVHRVRRAVHKVRTTVRATVSHIVHRVRHTVSHVVHRTRSFARRVFHSVRRIYHSARHAFHSASRSVRKGLRRAIEGAKRYIRHAMNRSRSRIDRIKGKLRNAWNWVKNKAKGVFDYVKKKVINVTNAIWNGSKRFVNNINGFVRDHPWIVPAFAIPVVGLPLLIGGVGLVNSGVVGGSVGAPSTNLSSGGIISQRQGFPLALDVFNPSAGEKTNVLWQLLSGMSLILPGAWTGAYLGQKVAGWYIDYKTLPDDADTSSWPWYKKMAVGWIVKGEAFIGQIGTAINQEIEARKKRQQMMTEAFERDGISGIAPYVLEEEFNIITTPFRPVANLIVGTYNYLSNEWKRDPWDGFWKTVGILAGAAATVIGVFGTPFTGGGSLALTALGLTMLASAVAVAGKESYEYTQAKTKKELFNLATDDTDEIVYVPSTTIGGALYTYHGYRMGQVNKIIDETPLKWKEGNLEGHAYPKHGEPNGMTLEEYKASSIQQLARAKGTMTDRSGLRIGVYEKNGLKIGIYDTKTKWFLPVSKEEGILTYFDIPSNNPDAYFFRQPNIYSLSPVDHPEIFVSGLVDSSASQSVNYYLNNSKTDD